MDSKLIMEWFHFAETDLALAKHALSMHKAIFYADQIHNFGPLNIARQELELVT